MDTLNTKPALSSLTVWAGIATMLSVLAPLFSDYIAPADYATAIEELGKVVAAVSGLVAIYGRVRATQKIG